MIPVLGIPILAGPELLWEMLASIDVPVRELVVIDNGCVVTEPPAGVPPFTLVRPGCNMGVAASWNHIIRMRPRAPWWMTAGYDVRFSPGDLAQLVEHMEMVGGVASILGFSAFALDRDAVRQVGFFDENFYPAYFEDNDYAYRCRLTGVSFTELPTGATHAVSSTIRNSRHYEKLNHYTFPLNREYFRQKWGEMPAREVFTTPFDAGGSPRDWKLSIDRLADQLWSPEE